MHTFNGHCMIRPSSAAFAFAPIVCVLLAQTPEALAAHAHHICHWNPEGLVQRDSISCRRETRHSPMGRFVPGFDTRTGNPIAREGYIVPCKRTSDCYARCPSHPLTGDRQANAATPVPTQTHKQLLHSS